MRDYLLTFPLLAAFLFAQAQEVPQIIEEPQAVDESVEALETPPFLIWDDKSGAWVPFNQYLNGHSGNVFSQVPQVAPTIMNGTEVLNRLFQSESDRLNSLHQLHVRGYF